MTPPSPKLSGSINRRQLLVVAVLVVGLYVVIPQFGDFKSSWQLMRTPSWPWVAGAVMLTLLTYFAGALTYLCLAFSRLRYGELVLVQMAAMFINRLLPAGIGAVGTNFAYLKQRRHNTIQAASVVAVNNCLGAVGHGLLVLVALGVSIGSGPVLRPAFGKPAASVFIGVGVLLVAAVLALYFSARLRASAQQLIKQLATYRYRKRRLALALLSSVLLTSCNVLSLTCCAQALGIQLDVAAMLLIFSFGVGAGTAIPTPGGVGAFEAGLVAGFAAYGVPAATALAAALLYRIVSYWLPLAAGAIAFVVAERRRLFTAA